jgi:hypothetical protein
MKETGELGRVISFANTHIIILNPTAASQGVAGGIDMLYVLAHEFGHPLFEQERKWLLNHPEILKKFEKTK